MEALGELGLTPNEARLYLLLAKSGRLKASELAKKAGLHRITVYDTMRQLEKKGLAGKIEEGGVTGFVASPPAALSSFLDEKREALESVMPGLSKVFEAEKGASVSVLYGKGGVKMVCEDILALRSDFCVYYGSLEIARMLPKFFPLFNERRKRLGIRARWALLGIPEARERAKSVPMAEFRYIDPSAVSGGVWWTYADRLVLFVVQKEDVITIYIKNEDLAKSFQKTFDDLFEKLPKK